VSRVLLFKVLRALKQSCDCLWGLTQGALEKLGKSGSFHWLDSEGLVQNSVQTCDYSTRIVEAALLFHVEVTLSLWGATGQVFLPPRVAHIDDHCEHWLRDEGQKLFVEAHDLGEGPLGRQPDLMHVLGEDFGGRFEGRPLKVGRGS